MRRLLVSLVVTGMLLVGCTTPERSPSGTVSAQDFKACLLQPVDTLPDVAVAKVARKGMEQSEKKLGIRVQITEVAQETELQPALDKFLSEQCSVILGVGQWQAETLKKAAVDNPKVRFVLVDGSIPQGEETAAELYNLKPLTFNTDEPAYLAGYLAAGTTITGRVATFGSAEYPRAMETMAGFANGVARYNADNGSGIEVNWTPVSQDQLLKPSLDVSQVLEETKLAIKDGADVIMPVAGRANAGALGAITGNSALVWVGVDGHEQVEDKESQALIMTSVLKRADIAVAQVIGEVRGNSFTAEPWVGTLANKGVDLAPLNDFEKRVPAELKNQLATLREQIKSGELPVLPPALAESS